MKCPNTNVFCLGGFSRRCGSRKSRNDNQTNRCELSEETAIFRCFPRANGLDNSIQERGGAALAIHSHSLLVDTTAWRWKLCRRRRPRSERWREARRWMAHVWGQGGGLPFWNHVPEVRNYSGKISESGLKGPTADFFSNLLFQHSHFQQQQQQQQPAHTSHTRTTRRLVSIHSPLLPPLLLLLHKL